MSFFKRTFKKAKKGVKKAVDKVEKVVDERTDEVKKAVDKSANKIEKVADKEVDKLEEGANLAGASQFCKFTKILIVIANGAKRNEAIAKSSYCDYYLPPGDASLTLHFITLVMTNYIFPHLGCSQLS
ncbi:hypothetical protein NIES267_69220 [Calothrix parasitica NIES-267]|uniref:Uncharacterized protein n=1 Tax=Calothrix parasitica NIES-267 TaxID=1973488 RepID=A0A1Z4M1Q7_9CYAN|nr:hypothetical protein NIES267_69220 [Calothrix parasitica NIES-267]